MRAAHALASLEQILEVAGGHRSNPVAAGRALQQIEDLARRATHVVARGGDHRPRALRDLHFSTWFTDNLGLLSSCAYR